ncbi:MAG: ATP-binding protein, partial [Dehalococcoidia bacterium]
QKHLTALEGTEGLRVDFRVEGEGKLPADQEEGLFRIAQEALNNVTKHAKTDRVAVTLRILKEEAWLLVEDEGVGFDPARRPADGEGFGLTSMRERVDILGGTLEIKSSPGQGTAILVKLPQAEGGRGK